MRPRDDTSDDLVREFGYLTLGTRLKRIGERLQADVTRLSARVGLAIPAAHYPLLAVLARRGPASIGVLAKHLGVRQPAITRSVLQLRAGGFVEADADPHDQRVKTVRLTEAGRDLVAKAERLLWPAVEATVRDLCEGLDGSLLDRLGALEDALVAAPLDRRVAASRLPTPRGRPMNPLDRPIWQALSTLQRGVSIGGARARAYAPDIGPLAASVDDDPASLADLARLVIEAGPLGLLQAGDPPLPPGCREDRRAPAVQMILTAPERLPAPADALRLGDADAAEMVELARLTAPGPFAARTHTLGRFHGVRVDGRLVAMAGERMRLPGFTEVSGVCTHPDFRGRGLSVALCARVVAEIRSRGEAPFLHAFADNHAAIALYRRLGFVVRAEMTFVRLAPA